LSYGEYADTVEKFLELENKLTQAIFERCEYFFMSNIYEDGMEEPSFQTQYDRWDELREFKEQNEMEYEREYKFNNPISDEEVHDEIMAQAEELYDAGWDLNEDMLKKIIKQDLEESKKSNLASYEYTFSGSDWQQGWLNLLYLDNRIPQGTKGVQLRWLRLALEYDHEFYIFASKKAYWRGMQCEIKLREAISDKATQQKL
jgi:hypothetical protein